MRHTVDHGPNHAEVEPRLTDELASVLTAARRRALRDEDRQIDTAHLLHTLLESDPAVRAAFGDDPRIARLLGYLVQRSIGYGLRWQGNVEDSGALPVTVAGVAGWSPAAARALEQAYERARWRGEERVHGVDLLASIVSSPASRAVEVLGSAGIDAKALARRIEAGAGAGVGFGVTEEGGGLGAVEGRGGFGAAAEEYVVGREVRH